MIGSIIAMLTTSGAPILVIQLLAQFMAMYAKLGLTFIAG